MNQQTENVTLTAAALRYWWLVALCTVAAGLAMFLFTQRAPAGEVAEAQLVLTDPQAGAFFSRGNVDPDRFAPDQVAILQSPAVARRAAAQLNDVDANQIERGLIVSGDRDSNQIVVSYETTRLGTAVSVVNSVVDSYRDIVGDTAEQRTAEAMNAFEAILAEIDAELAVADRTAEPQLLTRRANLIAEMSAYRVDSRLRADPVRVFSPAEEASPTARAGIRLFLPALMAGGLGGLMAAYYLALRNDRLREAADVTSRLDLQLIGEMDIQSEDDVVTPALILRPTRERSASQIRATGQALVAVTERAGAGLIGVVPSDATDAGIAVATAFAATGSRVGREIAIVQADPSAGRFGAELIESYGNGRADDSPVGLVRHLDIDGDSEFSIVYPPIFRSEREEDVRNGLRDLVDRFDQVIVVVPPPEKSSVAGPILRNVDIGILAIDSESLASDSRKVSDSLRVQGVAIEGAVYVEI